MGRTLVLEDFGGPLDALTAAGRGAALPEEQRLAAFEDGYQAGWDDAARALSESHQKLSADLAQNLGDLAFTFHEARAHVLKGVEPLLRQMVSRILPDVARHALPGLVVEMLDDMVKTSASAPVILKVSPESRAEIEAVLPTKPGFPLEVREEPTLAEGQVFIRTGEVEQAVDLTAALTEIEAAVDDFFNLNDERLQAHG
ncbi:MAG: flagellar biosynthesis protein [Rhodobacteraceae bacterium]|nr:flagellar biosynthesis protein [Paracoccaceae bacterium]